LQDKASEIFSRLQGTLHNKFIPMGTTVNKKVLIHLQEAIHLKFPEIWKAKHFMFLHDNAPAHQLLLEHQLTKHGIVMLPNHALCGFTSFHG
jgi:hypothetical protein